MSRRRLVVLFVALVVALPAEAQQRRVVFVNGLHELNSGWGTMQSGLAGLGIAFHYAPTTTILGYQLQASELLAQVNGFTAADTVVPVGHSNGGIVSRVAGQTRGLSGIVTFGTPHTGVPIATQLQNALNYATGVVATFNDLVYLATNLNANCYINYYYEDWCWSMWFVADAVVGNLIVPAFLGDVLSDFLPTQELFQQVQPSSQFLTSLNSTASLAAEAANVPTRVGIVATTVNGYTGGFLRLIQNPLEANSTAYTLATAGGLAYSVGWDAYAKADSLWTAFIYGSPIDWDLYYFLLEMGATLYDAGAYLWSYEAVWCSFVGAGTCGPSDSFIPVASQAYPQGTNVSVDAVWAHTGQRIDDAVIGRTRERLAIMLPQQP